MSSFEYNILIDLYNQWQDGRFNITAEDYNQLAAMILKTIDENNLSIEKLKRAAKVRRRWKMSVHGAT